MNKEQFNLLVEGNVETPVGKFLIVAKQKVSDKTEAGVFIPESMKSELAKIQDILTIIKTNEGSVFKSGQIIRAGRVLTQQTPLNSAVEGYDLVLVMEHDVMTIQKGFSE